MPLRTETHFNLLAYADWIRETDHHAEYHLQLLNRVQACLDRPQGRLEAKTLAVRLERWRYQVLNDLAADASETAGRFLDALEHARMRLRGSGTPRPRRVQQAINGTEFDLPTFRDALRALDPQYPLDDLARQARQLTAAEFAAPSAAQPGGKPPQQAGLAWPMLLYAPLYVSSQCVNWCTYCGFRYPRSIPRKHLSVDQAVAQARILRSRGFRHILIVGGDFPRHTTTEYYAGIARRLRDQGIEPAIEIAAQSTDGYAELASAGVCGVTLYQETYDEACYRDVHLRGPKASYAWRLEAHDRAAEAGIPRLGLGILLGLADPHADLLAMMRHGAYLNQRFPHGSLAFSLPRIREAPPGFEILHPVADQQLVRMYIALRLAFPSAVLVLSTRESPSLRDQLAGICITQLSAGSSTTPGGYDQHAPTRGEQFPVVDHRSPAQVARTLEDRGYRVCWSVAEQQGDA